MAGIAQRILLAARAGADRHHEPIGFHDTAAGNLDPDRAGYQHGAFGYYLNPGAGHGLSARITTSSSSRQPRRTRPVSSNHFARAESTGPNGIQRDATMSASKPLARRESSVCCTPANADCTNNRDPFWHNRFDADSHSGSSTRRPSGPASHAHDGPASGAIDVSVVNRRSGHIGRIGHHDLERSTAESPCPRTLPNVDLHPGVNGVVARASHGGRADIEGGDRWRSPIRQLRSRHNRSRYTDQAPDVPQRSRIVPLFPPAVGNLVAADTPRRLPRRQPGRDTWSSRAGLSVSSPRPITA